MTIFRGIRELLKELEDDLEDGEDEQVEDVNEPHVTHRSIS